MEASGLGGPNCGFEVKYCDMSSIIGIPVRLFGQSPEIMKATLQLWWPNFWEFLDLSIIGVIRFYAGSVLRLVLQLFLTFLYDKDLEQFGSLTVLFILLFCAWSFQLDKLVFSNESFLNVTEKMAKRENV